MAAPWLIGIAIDTAVPEAINGDYTSLTLVTAGLVCAAVISGTLRAVFVIRSGIIGQALLYDLRLKTYDHIQTLSVSFHEEVHVRGV